LLDPRPVCRGGAALTELSIDTASELASLALSDKGALLAEVTWRCRRNQTVELMPAIDRLLAQHGVALDEIAAVFVCNGAGMYTGLRVGIGTAKGLAAALGLPLLAVGRLELDAYPHAALPGPIVAAHRAGRGEWAWAAYAGEPWRQVQPPQLSPGAEVAAGIDDGLLLTGEADATLAGILRSAGKTCYLTTGAASVRRAGTLAELGHLHLAAGAASDPALVRAIYLRPPAIGAQKQSGG